MCLCTVKKLLANLVFHFQARFRGAAVRNSMRKVLEEYAAIFDEIEEKPSCSIKWHLAKHAVVGKIQFLPLDRRNCVQLNATKSDEPVNSDMSRPLVHDFSDKELQPVHFETPNAAKMNFELLNNDAPAISVPQSDNNTSNVNLTDLTSAVVMQRERKLDACNVDDRQNEDTSVDRSGRDNCDSATVISSVALQENFQTSGAGIPGTDSLSVLLNIARFAVREFQTFVEILKFFHLIVMSYN